MLQFQQFSSTNRSELDQYTIKLLAHGRSLLASMCRPGGDRIVGGLNRNVIYSNSIPNPRLNGSETEEARRITPTATLLESWTELVGNQTIHVRLPFARLFIDIE